jgi:hypothetical protein
VPDESSPHNHIAFMKVNYGDNIKNDVPKEMSGVDWVYKAKKNDCGQHLWLK